MNKDSLAIKDGHIISPHFSSYADRVCIEVVGAATGNCPSVELYCNTAGGESRLYATYPAAGHSCPLPQLQIFQAVRLYV